MSNLALSSEELLDVFEEPILIIDTETKKLVFKNESFKNEFSNFLFFHNLEIGMLDFFINLSEKDEIDFVSLKPKFSHYKLRKKRIKETNIFIYKFVDISEQVNAEAVNSQFLGIISHKFRDAIKNINLLLEKEVIKLNDDVNSEINFLSSLIHKLYYFFCEVNGPLRIFPSYHSFAYLIENVLKIIQPRMNMRKDLTIKVNYIEVDKNKEYLFDFIGMLTVLGTIVDNAITYSYSSTEIKITVELKNEMIVVDVYNEGTGIEPKNVPFVFEKSFHVDSFAKATKYDYSRYGIGLAYVKYILEAHNGDIELKNEYKKFVNVTFKFPVVTIDSKNNDENDPCLENLISVEGNRIKMHSDVRLLKKARIIIEQFLMKKLSLSKDDLFNLELCIDEAISNAVIHGNTIESGSNIIIEFELLENNVFTLTVNDNGGKKFSPAFFEKVANKKKWNKGGGRGISILYQMMDEHFYFINSNKFTQIFLAKKI